MAKSSTVRDALEGIRIALERQSAEDSKVVIEAFDRLRRDLELKTADEKKAVLDALESLRKDLKSYRAAGIIDYPRIANGPVEVVLAFNNDEHIKLLGPDKAPYFSSHGPLTDLDGNKLPGTRVATTFPVDPKKFNETETWPLPQNEPFDQPPLDNANVTGHGYSKQAYYFDEDKNWFVSVGPSLPKITRTKDGGAQFWVGSIGVIAQGKGRYEGARGVTTYVGSGHFDKWPDSFPEQMKLLRAGFRALIGTYVKVVLKKDLPGKRSGTKT
jgi:hypothetical protein